MRMSRFVRVSVFMFTATFALATWGQTAPPTMEQLEAANPIKPLPQSPLGVDRQLSDLPNPPTSQTVRLGRWLFFDKRISQDGSVSCATCHRPEHAFSEPTPTSTGIGGKVGGRKAPPVINHAFPVFPNFFWDGRADSLEAQAIGPMINPVEMGMPDHSTVVKNLSAVKQYAVYFKEAFGDETITIDRVAKALADYERTRMSGNSPWDRWQKEPDEADKGFNIEDHEDDNGVIDFEKIKFADGKHVTAQVKLGHYVFFNKAACNQCHLGLNFSDSLFHNLGVGWDAKEKKLKDEGRFVVSKKDEDRGAFKTPPLREVARHAPYMHDGSVATLRQVVELYDRGGEANPWLSTKMKPLKLTGKEMDALVAFMEALSGEGFADAAPGVFPQ